MDRCQSSPVLVRGAARFGSGPLVLDYPCCRHRALPDRRPRSTLLPLACRVRGHDFCQGCFWPPGECMSERSNTCLWCDGILGNRPDSIAVMAFEADGGVTQCTYGELARRSEACARGLLQRGVARGDRIGLMSRPSIDAVVAALGVLRAAAVLMPMDRQLDGNALRHVLTDGSPRMMLVDTDLVERVTETTSEIEATVTELTRLDELAASDGELPEAKPDDTILLFYTSGTTGPPKGVPLTNANIVAQRQAVVETGLVSEHDRVLLPLPLHHVYPLVVGLLTVLSLGVTVILPQSVTGPELVRAAHDGDATVMIGVPRLYRALYAGLEQRIAGGEGGRLAGRLLLWMTTGVRRRLGIRAGTVLLPMVRRRLGRRLRMLACGGAALDPKLYIRLEAMGWRVAIGYGLTETSPLVSVAMPGTKRIGTVGRPLRGVDVRIDYAAAPQGMQGQGEIQVRGPGVFHGYRNLPDENANTFTEDGYLRTGDLGYLDKDGYLFITGRVSTVIVTESGENVQPDELEDIYAEHPYIEEIGVLQDEGGLAAVVVPDVRAIRESGVSLEDALRRAFEEQKGQLPSYKHVSTYVVSRQKLSRTRLGKLRRQELVEHYRRIKEGEEETKGQGGPLPRDAMAEGDRELLDNTAVAQVWDILATRFADRKLTPESSPEVDLGMDSLTWLEITMEIRDRTGIVLDEATIGRIEKVRDLLRETAERAGGGPVEGPDPFAEPERVLQRRQRRWLKRPNACMRLLAAGLYCVNWLLLHVMFRLRARGVQRLPKSGCSVLAPNHASYMDAFALAAALPYRMLKDTAWAGGVEVAFANPLFRFVSRLAGAIPIEHGLHTASDMALAAAVLKEGRNLVWFPEGRRAPPGELLPFQPGVGMLLKQLKVPVIPVFIRGTDKAMPVGRALPRPTRVEVLFGTPLGPHELEARAGEVAGRSEGQRMANALRATVQELGST
ncbi:MAG: AMP-binding protein [Chitinivibrionales bacterium]|nr:AMP-binding protein [Chitinivibrionales bacterium]